VLGWGYVLELVHRVWEIKRHGNVNVPGIVVPVDDDAQEQGAGPVFHDSVECS
jgi:hypothetical protein